VIAAFLVSVGIGYCSALVQLHFQQASPGRLLPTADDAAMTYHGHTGMSKLERLLVADEGRPFNGSGNMRQAFTSKSAGWQAAINRRARKNNLTRGQAEEELRRERDGERLAVLDWIRNGADSKAFETNAYPLPAYLAKHPITEQFVDTGMDGTEQVKIASLIETRCSRCHGEARVGLGSQFPLDNWEQIHEYCGMETSDGGTSLKKLAQTSHIHLLGLAMLYGMTGLLFTFTSYPGWLKGLLGPFTLVAQVVDISLWWLGRLDPHLARAVVYTGCAVAVGLLLQIVLSLFNLFGRTGKIILLVLILVACLGGYALKEKVIDPYLAQEALVTTVD
jgi:hypothetical protein